jgi:acyl carrier protein
MVPSSFVELAVLPRTPNGKVDRAALPGADRTRSQLAEVYVEPRNEMEAGLARIWSEVLRVERVGIHDNFFELGGHSLLATQVISRVRDAYKLEVPLRRMFETPTIANLAVAIMEKGLEQIGEQDGLEMLQEVERLSADEVRIRLAENQQAQSHSNS